jgi:hypothetical protein
VPLPFAVHEHVLPLVVSFYVAKKAPGGIRQPASRSHVPRIPNDFEEPFAKRIGNAKLPKRVGRDTLALVTERQQEMLRAYAHMAKLRCPPSCEGKYLCGARRQFQR